ncbi:fatty acid--CoA ligase family protein [Streptomyces syringium]|uniref:class I adenylate-forming enzyme family protein n=1 Tax=Streptomyces syringium TaxID=76729 RepID=UPI00341B83EF
MMNYALPVSDITSGAEWVEETFLRGLSSEVCIVLDEEVKRGFLRQSVHDCARELADAGLAAGGVAALRLPPSLEFAVNLLAVWHLGAQAVLLDHRLAAAECREALQLTAPQLVLSAEKPTCGLQYFHQVNVKITSYPGLPAATSHALVQLSSGSTGPAKVIGRTVADLSAELERYKATVGMPTPGERMISLASLSHTYALVGGLLYSLHNGIRFTLPRCSAVTRIFDTILEYPAPTMLMGIPDQFSLLGRVNDPPHFPQLRQALSGGARIEPMAAHIFSDRYRVPLGECYGMTETGVLATDMSGARRPATGWAAPGVNIRVEEGELLVATSASPYIYDHIGKKPSGRWADGWLRTHDAGEIDSAGLIRIRGRLDSQVSIRGLKVNLMEVEEALSSVSGVREAVVLYVNGINAYLSLEGTTTIQWVKEVLSFQLADFKLPRRWHVLHHLPRTATGKVLRDPNALRSAIAREECV